MCVALVMGNMIGSGVFLLPASMATFGWDGVGGWVVTIAGSVLLAYVLAQLTLQLPQAGGPVGFVRAAFGDVPGFLIGWSYWVSIWTAMVTIAVAAISYLSVFVPALANHAALATIGLIWIITALNWRGARRAGEFQVITVLIKCVPLLVIIVLIVFVLAQQGTARLTPFPTTGFTLSGINAAAILALWAMLGFESAAIAADKVEDAARTIPRATLVGTIATGLLFLLVCSGITLLLPTAQLAKSPAPFELFVATYWSPRAAFFVAAFAAVSAIGALSGWCLMQAEVPAAMARRGLLPPVLARENRFGTATWSLVLSSIIASIFVALNAQKSTGDLFAFMAKLSTSATLWLYLACALAALRLKIAAPTAILGSLFALFTLWGAGIPVSLLSFALMAVGLPVYLWTVRSRAAQHTA